MTAKNNWPDIFPTIPGNPSNPKWTGNGFLVGKEILPVLSYEKGNSGWTDDLTTFHEETAGESHFIDQASRKQAISQLTKQIKTDMPVIMDIGCSSGFLIKDIKRVFPGAFVVGTDVVMGPLMKLAGTNPDIPLLHFDLTRCPLPDNSVDAVVLLNVLEHIENDGLAVRQLFRILKPGGLAVIEVPAGPELYDIYDEHLMHYRRYKLSDLQRIFLDGKFSVLHQSHLGFFLYPGFFLVKKLRRGKRADIPDEEIPQQVSRDIKETGVNPFFHMLMEIELQAGKLISYPFGIRCLLTARKMEG